MNRELSTRERKLIALLLRLSGAVFILGAIPPFLAGVGITDESKLPDSLTPVWVKASIGLAIGTAIILSARKLRDPSQDTGSLKEKRSPSQMVHDHRATAPFGASIEIDATADEIWPYLVEHAPEYRFPVGLISSEAVTDGPLQEGSRSRSIHRLNGKTLNAESEVLRIVKNELLVTATVFGDHVTLQHTTLTEHGSPTTVTMKMRVTFSKLAWFYLPLSAMMQGVNRRLMRENLARLKQKVEDPTAPLEPAEHSPALKRVRFASVALNVVVVSALAWLLLGYVSG